MVTSETFFVSEDKVSSRGYLFQIILNSYMHFKYFEERAEVYKI